MSSCCFCLPHHTTHIIPFCHFNNTISFSIQISEVNEWMSKCLVCPMENEWIINPNSYIYVYAVSIHSENYKQSIKGLMGMNDIAEAVSVVRVKKFMMIHLLIPQSLSLILSNVVAHCIHSIYVNALEL